MYAQQDTVTAEVRSKSLKTRKAQNTKIPTNMNLPPNPEVIASRYEKPFSFETGVATEHGFIAEIIV